MSNELSKNLKYLLEQHRISARKLAKETGVSISTISDILNGRQPSLKNFQIIATYFDVSLDYLLYGKQQKVSIVQSDDLDFDDLFEGIVKIKISKLKEKR